MKQYKIVDVNYVINKAKQLGSKLNQSSLYGIVFKQNQHNIEHVLFEIAQQANSNKYSKSGVITAVGSELVGLAVLMYPEAKIGDAYPMKKL